jgi:hypothetical protein
MSNRTTIQLITAVFLVSAPSLSFSQKETDRPKGSMVHVVITDMADNDNSDLPPLLKDDVKVKQGKNMYTVTQLVPARDRSAAVQLMIMIDETLNTQAVGNNLTELKEFVKAQPASTAIGVAYMSNAGIDVVQQFTTDHEAAAKSIRLPRGNRS